MKKVLAPLSIQKTRTRMPTLSLWYYKFDDKKKEPTDEPLVAHPLREFLQV
jgi:hypothetical protein